MSRKTKPTPSATQEHIGSLQPNGVPLPLEPAKVELYTPVAEIPVSHLKLDLGCGMNKREGFVGVDKISFPGVDVVCNLVARDNGSQSRMPDGRTMTMPGTGKYIPWPFKDNSVVEAHSSHFLEHLTNLDNRFERVWFFNELYRILVPGGKATIIIPYWASPRYYGDPTHKEPFSEWGFLYINKEWRMGDKEKGLGANAPHDDASNVPGMYSCDFTYAIGYGLNPKIAVRNQEYQQYALEFLLGAATDIITTLTARK